ncbi:hypothetical protein NXH76_16655 [Blautia schinkii]|nr:hypothetical protein [Blautia schinkii]
MTLLGQMLMEDGIEKGINQGIELAKAALKLSAQGESPESIANKLQTSLETVHKILED